jgi:GNAT superfamily N-acetyltransferase
MQSIVRDALYDARMRRPEPVGIRAASVDDTEALFPLAREMATTFVPTDVAFVESLSRLSADPNAMLIVAEENATRRLVGYLLGFRHDTFFADGPVGWVEELYVRPEARRGGIGVTLMEAFERWAWASGASMVALATRRAEKFYEAIGYEASAVYVRKVAPGRATSR